MDVDVEADQGPGFDLEAYIAPYKGHAKINRLLYIAEQCKGQGLEVEAGRLAVQALQQQEAVELYRSVLTPETSPFSEETLRALGPIDTAWASATHKRMVELEHRLQGKLRQDQTNMIKESIRMGHNAVGDYYYAQMTQQALQEAFKSYSRARDYCSSNRHMIATCLHICQVAAEMGQWALMLTYARKALDTPQNEEPVTQAKLRAAEGLALLRLRRFPEAGTAFTSVAAQLENHWSDVVASQDVAVYGALCALATFPRPTLVERVSQSVDFREMLELVPDIREAVECYLLSSYARCLALLERCRPWLRMDMHLHGVADELLSLVRARALVDYVTPFEKVDLVKMAAAFDLSVGDLEAELASLIGRNMIKARIDAHNKVLVASRPNPRMEALSKVKLAGDHMVRTMQTAVLRSSLISNGVCFKRGGGQVGASLRPRGPRGRGGPGGVVEAHEGGSESGEDGDGEDGQGPGLLEEGFMGGDGGDVGAAME